MTSFKTWLEVLDGQDRMALLTKRWQIADEVAQGDYELYLITDGSM